MGSEMCIRDSAEPYGVPHDCITATYMGVPRCTYLNYLLKPIEVVDSQEPGLLQSIGRAMIGITATYIWEYPHAPV